VETVTPSAVSFERGRATPASGSLLSPREWGGTALPAEVATHPLLDEAAWVELRDSGRDPLDESDLVTTYQSRAEFLVGVWALKFVIPERFGLGTLLDNLQPQMLREVDMLAAGETVNGILMPRRSSKTTTLWCVLVGRCWMRPEYMAGYTMLTLAKKAEKRFELDVRNPITRHWRDPKTRPVKLRDGKGSKGIDFPNGSVLDVLAPKGEEVRSGAYDIMVLDEAGEADPELWAEIVSAVLPAFDTRPGAQAVLAGTAARYRTGGHFWKTLHNPRAGRLRYGVPDDIDPQHLEFWDTVKGLIEQVHPGLDGLTTMAHMVENFEGLGWELFAAEYLGHFGDENATATAISAAAWKKGRQDGPPPEGITSGSLAVAVSPDGSNASIVVAWHITDSHDLAAAAWELDGITEQPRIGIKLLHVGTDRLERVLIQTARALRAPIVYDHGNSATRAVVERVLKRARPRPVVMPKQLPDVRVAHAQLGVALNGGNVWHWDQAPLDRAAEKAVLAIVGQGMLIRSPRGESLNVTPLEAAALALDALPESPRESLQAGAVWDFGDE